MSIAVCVGAQSIYYPEGGGHLWVFLNWALGLRGLGCRVIWLEPVHAETPAAEVQQKVRSLKSRLSPYGLDDCIALCSFSGEALSGAAVAGCLSLDAAIETDLLLNIQYDMPPAVVSRFRRSALLDIDPGLLQIWVSNGRIELAPHDVYFTIGETVGQPGAPFSDLGLEWHYTPPCVALDWWPASRTHDQAPFTTVAHWFASAAVNAAGLDTKRDGFLPFLDLPRRTSVALELATDLGPDDEDQRVLSERGWGVRHAHAVASTPWEYQQYIQSSRGEFSCAKPACIRLQNAWISDRTICYLASGKPAVVEHTGSSRFLPADAGLFRFRDLAEAARCLDTVAADYKEQSRLARALAEERFDAHRVVSRVLERALP